MRIKLYSIPVVAVTVWTAFLFTLAGSSAIAQQRHHYGMLLEPVDGILHGAGQDPAGFQGYWDSMEDGEKPIAYMYYIDLQSIHDEWARTLKNTLLTYKDQMIVLQIGLELTSGGVPYTDQVSSGALDAQIETFIDGLNSIGLPSYVRIGYEFNGVSWNGYQPESFKTAFRHIAEKIKERDLEIATVWNYAADGVTNFMAYHPGDDVIDWWSPNVFSASHLTNSTVLAYIDSAHVHQRPLLIGESTPRYIGTTRGEAAWTSWFTPYFNLLRNNPGIKMFSYINWNWADFPQWADWGDARLESNELVRLNYQAEMDSSVYVHAGSESEFRALLDYTDSVAPQMGDISVADTTFPATIAWAEPADASKIARYLIYDDGELIDYTGKQEYAFQETGTGDVKSITVVAVDRAGNQSDPSVSVEVKIPGEVNDPREQLSNGNFELGGAFWDLTNFVAGAEGELQIDTTGSMEGVKAASVSISSTTNTNWHIQLRQPMAVNEGKRYAIEYKARADAPTTMEMWLQQDHDPFLGYAMHTAALTTETQTFADTAEVTRDDTVYMTFMVGNSGLNKIWVDDVKVRLLDSGVGRERQEASELSFVITEPYPNPFVTRTSIDYSLRSRAHVSVRVHNLMGQLVATLIDGEQSEGAHTATWQAEDVASGLYLVRVESDGTVQTFGVVRQK